MESKKICFFGGVHTVLETSPGIIEGSGDQRRSGISIIHVYLYADY